MDDQQMQNQKPTLTPEEELDVLEAVWKIGQEKGLDLLRPEQIKRLVDTGRITYRKISLEPSAPQNNIAEQFQGDSSKTVPEESITFLVAGLRAKVASELTAQLQPEGWGGFTEGQKQYAISCYFAYVYGVTEHDMVDAMMGRNADGN
jgi:hypothetical protein